MNNNQHQETLSEDAAIEDDNAFWERRKKENFFRFFKDEGLDAVSQRNAWLLYRSVLDTLDDDENSERPREVYVLFALFIKSFHFSREKALHIMKVIEDWLEDELWERFESSLSDAEMEVYLSSL